MGRRRGQSENLSKPSRGVPEQLVGTRSPSGKGGGGGGQQAFMNREALGYDHGYDAQKSYLGLALGPKYVEGFVEGCLERNR